MCNEKVINMRIIFVFFNYRYLPISDWSVSSDGVTLDKKKRKRSRRLGGPVYLQHREKIWEIFLIREEDKH
jgi:hypothetical protein